jgi:amino acid transporter
VKYDDEWDDDSWGEQPKKREGKPSRSKKPIAAIVVAIIVSIIIVIGIVVAVVLLSGNDTNSPSNTYQIQYKVWGLNTDSAFGIVYTRSDGEIITELYSVDLPWTYSGTFKSGDYVGVSAVGDASSENILIAVEIYKDGNLWKLDSDQGDGAVQALAEGILN